jgi:anti-anti-sigma regulatory factor
MTVNDDKIQQLGRVLLVRCGHRPLDGESGSSGVNVRDIIAKARNGGARTVLLDATVSPYADSGGLRWLLHLKQEAEENGLSLRTVTAPGSKIERNLSLLKAGFDIYEDLHTAWSANGGSPGRALHRTH